MAARAYASAARLACSKSSHVVRTSRFLSTEATLSTSVKESGGALAAPAAAPAPPPAATPITVKRGSSLVDRLWAFFAGVGVGGVVGYFKLSEDIVESTAEIDTRIINLRTDVASANEALRRRVATLEHQVQELQDRVQQ